MPGPLALTTLFLCAWSSGNARAGERPEVRSFDSNGVKIAYFVQGSGEPVVLIHGWLSSAGINWALPGISDLLSRHFRVIALDVRGHGLSDKPTNADSYGPELVEDIVRLLDHLEIRKAHIVGYSMGGIIAANFLAKHPDRALSGLLGGAGWLRVGSIEQRLFAAGGRDGKPVGLCFQGLAKLALTEKEIASIPVPVEMIIGEQDRLKAVYVDPLSKIHPDWPVVEIRDADHISCILKPQFREEIAAWLKKHTPATN
jgi:pimeloyl-ACP methyl ester carboxylesterase